MGYELVSSDLVAVRGNDEPLVIVSSLAASLPPIFYVLFLW